jgi:transposase
MTESTRPDQRFVVLTREQRWTLTSCATRGSTAPWLARRARIVLAAADPRAGAARSQATRRTVRRLCARFLHGGLRGLLDAPRPGRPPQITARAAERVVALLKSPTPAGVKHWSTRAIARATGCSQSSISRMWRTLERRTLRTTKEAVRRTRFYAARPPGGWDRVAIQLLCRSRFHQGRRQVEVDRDRDAVRLAIATGRLRKVGRAYEGYCGDCWRIVNGRRAGKKNMRSQQRAVLGRTRTREAVRDLIERAEDGDAQALATVKREHTAAVLERRGLKSRRYVNIAEARRLHKAGKSLRAVAKALGVSHSTLRKSWLEQSPKDYPHVATPAKRIDLSLAARGKGRRVVDPAEILPLLKAGHGWAAIERVTGIPRATVRGHYVAASQRSPRDYPPPSSFIRPPRAQRTAEQKAARIMEIAAELGGRVSYEVLRRRVRWKRDLRVVLEELRRRGRVTLERSKPARGPKRLWIQSAAAAPTSAAVTASS